MKRDHRLYLKDIVSAIESILSFVKTMDFEEFQKDDKTTSAVIRKFEIIGEATKQIPEDIRQKYSLIPWKEMAGMRDRLIHFYIGVDYHLIWETIHTRLADLKFSIEHILNQS